MAGLLGRVLSHEMTGVVERKTPWTGPDGTNGTLMVLAGHARPYLFLHPLRIGGAIGLTQPGDEITMRVRAQKHYYLVDTDTLHNPAIVDYLVD
ncbi:hypothetical protein QZN30_03725 [Burkholderia multivorans]|nr:hypothetical protein [Burkholderia multivorans]